MNLDNFTGEEINIILETARVALGDAEMFDMIAEELDVDDEAMSELVEKLQEYMN